MENKKRLIDANTFRKQLIDRQITTAFFNAEQRNEIGCVIELLDKQPTIDAVEVVRCMDCKNMIGKGRCSIHSTPMTRMDFCSYGERRTDV